MVEKCRKGSIMPKGPLGKAEKFTIEVMHSQGDSIDDISEFLGRSSSSISNYIDSLPSEDSQEESGETKEGNKSMFIRQTATKGTKNVSIMTATESSRSEMSKQSNQSKIVSKLRPHIHKINSDNG